MSQRLIPILVVASTLAATGQTQPAVPSELITMAEASGFKSTSTYESVVQLMKAADAKSPVIFYTTYGKTFEGREMPLAVVGTGLKDASPAAVRATGRLRVHIQGNVHAGEVEGKESAQILLREFALGQHQDWLKSMVFIINPIYNADGNEKMSPTNRGAQNGPINGMGTRNQAQNMNLNRDYMKLDAPEGKANAKLYVDYDPHVSYDLHTSNGSNHAYFLTYSPPLNPNTSETIMRIMKDEWFPFVTKQVKAKHGWDMFYYGNVEGGRGGGAGRGAGRGAVPPPAGAAQPPPPPPPTTQPPPAAPAGPRAWGTFEHVPRFHNNYVGMRNRFALLTEAYSYATFEDRIKATSYFIEESLTFAHQNAKRLQAAVAAADKENMIGQELATRAQKKTGGLIEILMGEVEQEPNPVVEKRMMNRRVNVSKPEQMVDRLWFEPTSKELVPAEFYVPAEATAALELLRRHGVQMRQLTKPVVGVEEFTIAKNDQRPVGGGDGLGPHGLRTLEGSWAATDAPVPAGSWAVPMNQPLARLAFYLLAPTSDDGLVTWNFLDDKLGADVKVYPITRKK